MKKIFIVSITSDIGFELAKYWKKKGYNVSGTYRSKSNNYLELKKLKICLFKCDLSFKKSINNFLAVLDKKYKWDWLILAAGLQDPIGKFIKINFDEWEDSLFVNFISMTRILNFLLKLRNINSKNGSRVLFFAGGGTNNATSNYSAYTISKIATIKLCELLDYEIKDTIFSTIGPGWVKTKIHLSTLRNKKGSGDNFNKTKMMLDKNKSYPIEKVVKCCDWIMTEKKEIVSGRNFSAVHDPWGTKKIEKISSNENFFKLRRFGNDIFKNNNNLK